MNNNTQQQQQGMQGMQGMQGVYASYTSSQLPPQYSSYAPNQQQQQQYASNQQPLQQQPLQYVSQQQYAPSAPPQTPQLYPPNTTPQYSSNIPQVYTQQQPQQQFYPPPQPVVVGGAYLQQQQQQQAVFPPSSLYSTGGGGGIYTSNTGGGGVYTSGGGGGGYPASISPAFIPSNIPPSQKDIKDGGVTKGGKYTTYFQQLSKQQLDHLKAWFDSVDKDRSGSIDVNELSQMKMPDSTSPTSQGRNLGYPAASILIRLFDQDNSNTIDFYEYAALHSFLDQMNLSFHKADSDHNGTLDSFEINNAMREAGFIVSHDAVKLYFKKYDPFNRGLSFVTYMQMAAEMALVRSKFDWADLDHDGKVTLDEVLMIVGDITSSTPPPPPPSSSNPSSQYAQSHNQAQNCTIS